MGWFSDLFEDIFGVDFFADEVIISVGGGVSRIRADSSIRDTMGLAINSAVMGGQDIGEAIRLHAATSTTSSYKQFERKCRQSSTIGLPYTVFVYSGVSKEQLAAAIRNLTGQSFPVAAEIDNGDISSETLTSDNHVLYALQENKAYNLSSNMFTHLGIDYVFDSYTDQFSGSAHIGYTINGHIDLPTYLETTFTLAVPKPAATVDVAATDEYGAPTTVTLPVAHWVVLYTHLGREYIWIYDTRSIIFQEVDLAVTSNTYPELQFAPIVNIRNNRNHITGTALAEANRALNYISLDSASINAQITDPAVEDVSISLFSNLISEHQDQLAYNFAFFDYMADISINDETAYNLANSGVLANSPIFNYNKISVNKEGVYFNDTSWAYITRTNVTGVLGTDYTYSFSPSASITWMFEVHPCDYIVRKQINETTYTEIFVKNFFINYTVSASEGVVKLFTVDISVDTATTTSQLVIPFSYEIALSIPGKYRETIFMRCTQIALFSKTVTTRKWYQQDWFRDLITVITIVALVLTAIYAPGYIQALTTAAEQLVGTVVLGGVVITSITAAYIYLIAQYAIVQYALKAVLVKILTSTDNQLLQIFATVGYAYLAMKITPGSISSTKQTLLGALDAGYTGVSTVVGENNRKLGIELQSLQQISLGEKEQIEKANTINAQFEAEEENYRKAQEALGIRNLFCNLGVPYINSADVQGYEVNSNISTMSNLIAEFCKKKELTPFELMQQTDNLVLS